MSNIAPTTGPDQGTDPAAGPPASGTTDPAATPGAPEVGSTPDPAQAADQGTAQAAATGAQDTGDDTGDKDPRVSAANNEAAKTRLKLREQEKAFEELQGKYENILKGLGSLAGIPSEEGQEPDPDEALKAALAERDEARKEIRETRVNNALRDASAAEKLNARLLLPLLRGEGKLDALDPSADDFQAQVAAVISEAKDAYPELRSQAVPSSSGQTANPPAQSSAGKLSQEDLSRLAAEGKWAEINKAAAEGRV